MAQTSSPFIHSLTPRNLLSFGPDTAPLSLGSLNVLVGPNGSGKSNLIETLALLRATSRDVREVVTRGGGVAEWIWKGKSASPAVIDLVMTNPLGGERLRHVFAFRMENQTFRLDDERVENERPFESWQQDVYFYYRYQHGHPVLSLNTGDKRALSRESIEIDQSILLQRRDPDTYPEISYLADMYRRISIFREWTFGRNTVFRTPQPADMRDDRLEEDFSNIGLFLSRLRLDVRAKNAMLAALKDLYQGLDDFEVNTKGGTVQVYFHEGDFTIPAIRLSDGTVRYLCLLAILCDPTPPPVICLEEPELGLHPDIIPKIADLLVAASERTQLIVTTHSDILVDALTDYPEAVVVCEKHEGQTSMQRLDRQSLAQWLEKYRLGELWMRGHLGGTRW